MSRSRMTAGGALGDFDLKDRVRRCPPGVQQARYHPHGDAFLTGTAQTGSAAQAEGRACGVQAERIGAGGSLYPAIGSKMLVGRRGRLDCPAAVLGEMVC